MSTTDQTARVQVTLATATDVVSFPYKFLESNDLVVSSDGRGTLVLDTDYSVTGAGDSGGGNVTMIGGTVAERITVTRSTDNSQETTIATNGPLSSSGLEAALDKLTKISQDLAEEIARAIKFPHSDVNGWVSEIELAEDRINKIFSFGASGEIEFIEAIGTWKGDWAGATEYIKYDFFKDTTNAATLNNVYIVLVAHTSDTVSNDLASNNIALILDAKAAADSAVAAAASAAAASTSEGNAASSAAAALASELAAAASEAAAAASESEAATSETNAAASATDAEGFSALTSSNTNFSVSSIAALKALDTTGYPDNYTINLLGFNFEGDGNGYAYFWDESSTLINDDDNVIEPTAGGIGRWRKSKSDAKLKTRFQSIFELPSEFTFDPQYPIINNNGWAMDVDFSSFDLVTVDLTRYVNINTGSNSNDGLTAETAWAEVDYALSVLGGITTPSSNVRLYVAAGYYDRVANFNSQPVEFNLSMICPDSEPARFSSSVAGTVVSWVDEGSGAFSTTISQSYSAVDYTNIDENGDYVQLTEQASLAAVQSAASSYYITGSTVYIKTHDSREPDADLYVLKTTPTPAYNISSEDLTFYIRNFIFEGGANGFSINNDSTGQRIYLDQCVAQYCQNVGFRTSNLLGSQVWTHRCVAKFVGSDGFSVHAFDYAGTPSNVAGDSVNLYDTAYACGVDATATSNNGFTVHEDARVLRVGCYGVGNNNREYHDVTDALSLNIGCIAGTGVSSLATAEQYQGGFCAGHPNGDQFTRMWLIDCKVVNTSNRELPNAYDIVCYSGGKCHLINTHPDTSKVLAYGEIIGFNKQFDGFSGGIDVGAAGALNFAAKHPLSTSDFTIEWSHFTEFQTSGSYGIYRSGTANDLLSFSYNYNNEEFSVVITDPVGSVLVNEQIPYSDYSDGIYSANFDRNGLLRIFKYGMEIGQADISAASAVDIGNATTGLPQALRFLDCHSDRFTIWQRLLTDDEVIDRAEGKSVGGAAPFLDLDMSHGRGTIAYDRSGNGYDATLVTATWLDFKPEELTTIAAGIHTWAGGAATTDSISITGLLSTDVIICTLVARAGTEVLELAVNDDGNDQIDLTLSANGTNGTTKISYQVIRSL